MTPTKSKTVESAGFSLSYIKRYINFTDYIISVVMYRIYERMEKKYAMSLFKVIYSVEQLRNLVKV